MEFSVILADTIKGVGREGQRVSLELIPSDVRTPTEMPGYLAGYKPPGYRADEASPPILVDHDEDKFRTFSSDDSFRRVVVKGSLTGAVPEVDPKSSLDSYKVVDRYVGSFVPKITEMQSNYNVRMAALRRARRALELDREIDVWTLFATTGSWAAGNVLALGATYNWNGGTASDPVKDIQTAVEASAQQVTDIWINQKVANAFIRHDKVRDHMRQFLGDSAAPGALAQVAQASISLVDFAIPGLPPIHVVPGKKLNETTSALDFILGDVVVLTGKPPGTPTDGEEIATSYTFRRRGPSGTGMEAREFFVDGRGPNGGTMIVCAMADVVKMTGTNVGGLITNVWV
jgi:hypothetical protein